MDIIRNPDGTLVVPVPADRRDTVDEADGADDGTDDAAAVAAEGPTTRVLHPGEGGYDVALAAWAGQDNPDQPAVVSTASGREEAMSVVHAVSASADHAGGARGRGAPRP